MSFMKTRSTNFFLSLFFVVLMNLQGNINLFWWKKLDKKCYYISKTFFFSFPIIMQFKIYYFYTRQQTSIKLFFLFSCARKECGRTLVSQFINLLIKRDFYHIEYNLHFSLKSKLFTVIAHKKCISSREEMCIINLNL